VAIHHRIGRVELCETAVVVAVSSPHRQDAFETAQYCIDALKESVPMWKRDLCKGGSAWSADTQTVLNLQK
jgi:molybdopterin synthase catalytic subunit